jgi:hypothetical protein
MLDLHIEKISDLAVVEREGRVVRREAAVKREAVTSLLNARIIVLHLPEERAIEGGGLGMLLFLKRWACLIGVRNGMFAPSSRRKQEELSL